MNKGTSSLPPIHVTATSKDRIDGDMISIQFNLRPIIGDISHRWMQDILSDSRDGLELLVTHASMNLEAFDPAARWAIQSFDQVLSGSVHFGISSGEYDVKILSVENFCIYVFKTMPEVTTLDGIAPRYSTLFQAWRESSQDLIPDHL